MPLVSDSLRGTASALTILAIVIAGLVLGKDILIPMALAAILAFILAPIVRRFSTMLPHGLSVAIVTLAFIGAIVLASGAISNQVLSLAAELGTYRENILEKVRLIRGVSREDGIIKKAAEAVDSLGTAIEQELKANPDGTAGSGQAKPPIHVEQRPPAAVVVADENTDVWREYLGPIEPFIEPGAMAGLSLLMMLFLLLQHADLRDRVIRVAGTNNITGTTGAMNEAGERLSELFLMQALLNAGFGVFIAAALSLIGVPNAPLWGVVAAVMRFVPFIGSILAAVPPILLAAAVDPGWTMVGATAMIFVIGEPLMGHVVEPLVLGKRAGLSPLAMVVAASFWTVIWGPIGLILAAPLTMILVVLGRYVTGLEVFTVLLGDQPALSPQESFYHRLLSRDAASGAAQVEDAVEAGNVAAASDQIVLPALNLAAADAKWGRLEDEEIISFRETFATFMDMMTEVLPEAARPHDGGRLLIVPARGDIDAIAADYLAKVLPALTGSAATTVTGASGMTALAQAKAAAEKADTMVLVTVGGLEKQHLKFILRRAARDFPGTRVVVLDWGREDLNPGDLTELRDVSRYMTLAGLLENVNVGPAAGRPAATEGDVTPLPLAV